MNEDNLIEINMKNASPEKEDEISQNNEDVEDADDIEENQNYNSNEENEFEDASSSIHLQSSSTEDQGLEEHPQLRHSNRSNLGVPPNRLMAGVATKTDQEPSTFKEAMMSLNNFELRAAAEEEMQSMEKNGAWALIEPPKNAKVIGCKWIFKLKTNDEGFAIKRKARLVAQGFSQKFGLDYDEVFAPVVRASTFQTLLAIAGKEKLKVHHYGVKPAFLNGDLKETVLMKQPEGFKVQGKEHLVCKLNKSIYGLKQAAKSWNDKLNSTLLSLGFTQAKADTCLFFKNTQKGKIYLISYVDDLLIASKDEDLIFQTGQNLGKHFQLTSLGKIKNYLRIQIEQDEDDFFSLN